MNETVGIKLELDTGNFKKKMDESRYDFEKMRERMESTNFFKLSVDISRIKQDLAEAKKLLKIAEGRGDLNAQIEISVDVQKMERELQIAKMKARNYVNTGDEGVSVLGKMFDKVGDKAAKSLDAMRTDLLKLGRSSKEVDTLIARLNRLNEEFNNGKRSQDDYYKELGKIEAKMNSMNSGGLLGGMKSMAGKAVAGFGAVAFLGDSFTLAKEFGTQVQRAGTIAGATKQEVAQLKDEILKLSNATGISNVEIATTAETLASAGIKMKDIPALLQTITTASVASGANTSSIFQGLQAVINGYGYSLSDAAAISDIFFRANAQGTISIEALATEIGTVVPIANAGNVGIRELAAGFSTLTGVTGNASEVATQLKGAIQAIVAPSEEGRKAMERLGIEYGANAIAAKGFGGVMKDIYDKAKGNPELIKAMIPEVRSLTAVLALGGEQSTKFAENLQGLQNAVGDTNRAFESYTQSDEFRAQRGVTAWENFKTSVGGVLLSLFATFADFFSVIGQQMSDLVDMIFTGWSYILNSITDALGITSEETRNSVDNQVSYWDKLFTFLTFIWSSIVGVIQGIFVTITQMVSDLVGGIVGYFDNLGVNLKKSLVATGSAIANTVLGIVNNTVNLLLIPINTASDGLNQVIARANKVPGVNIGSIGNISANFSVGDGKGIFDRVGEGLKKLGGSIIGTQKTSFIERIKTNFHDAFVKTISKFDSQKNVSVDQTAKSLTDKNAKTFDTSMPKTSGGGGAGGAKKGGGGGGKSKAQKEEEDAAKKAKKAEEDLAKARTNAYDEGKKRADKFQEVVVSTNKKLEEQRQKLAELKKEATETIKDLEEKLTNNKSDFNDKLAKRYSDILQSISDKYKDNNDKNLFTHEELAQRIEDGSIAIDNKLKEELILIQKQITEQELKLAITKENRSETEKMTEEYLKQKGILEQSMALQNAVKDGRYTQNTEGGYDFFDANGKKIEGGTRDQQKEIQAQSKKLKDIADEELKIQQEKEQKIADIVKEFADEKIKLNENYFNEDKDLRIRQENMMQEFFQNEIMRMQGMREEAIRLTQALLSLRSVGGSPQVITNNYNNTSNATNTQNVSVRTVADVNSINAALGSKISQHL